MHETSLDTNPAPSSIAHLLDTPQVQGDAGSSDSPAEWLVTNGLGGYAFGTVAGPPSRRFHALLVAALPAPMGRLLLLHGVDEHVTVDGTPGAIVAALGHDAPPHSPPPSFALVAGLPVWRYAITPELTLERALMLPHGENTVHLRYRLIGAAARWRLTVRPWLDPRPHQATLSPQQTTACRAVPAGPGRIEMEPHGAPPVRLAITGGEVSFTPDLRQCHDVPYPMERERGYDWLGSACSPGACTVVLEPGHEAHVTASAEAWAHFEALPPAQAWEAELARRERLVAASHPALQTAATFGLALAADQFVIRPAARADDTVRARAAGAEPRSVIAGYPWFTDWGRDTMISLEGLTLATGRAHEARDILRTFALHVQDGLIPNLFPEGERLGLYHTADATLWFFHALDRYDTLTGDESLVDELLPALESIVDHHQRGTRFNIRVDADGLLAQGAAGFALTWMDARMDEWVVTPRRGKAVEINALWHNALWLLHGWLARRGREDDADALAGVAQRCATAFNARFWNAERGYLFDVVDGEQGDDPACRPNQLMAVSLRHPALDESRWAAVLHVVTTQLLTPLGVRTLAPFEPGYHASYHGDLRARDGAYHQGTAWPWLIGPYVDAWLRVHPGDAAGALTAVAPLLAHVLGTACLGSISEIADAEPPFTARGCVAQAWSVAELARVLVTLHPADGTGALP